MEMELNMSKIWVYRFGFTEGVCTICSAQATKDENVFYNIMTCDETLCFQYDAEKKSKDLYKW